MHRLEFLDSAERDLTEIAGYIARESRSEETARTFLGRLIARCEEIALIDRQLGKARPELRAGCRSMTFGTYAIFFRYLQQGDESVLQVMHNVHGRRDIEAFFRREDEEEPGQ